MRKNSKVTSILSKIFVPAFALLILSNCTADEEVKRDVVKTQDVAGATTGVKDQEEPVLSLTIDGTYTELVSTADCKTCHYIVPANATTVDGNTIGIKPGQAICLDAAIKYGNLNFINLNGEANSPITIAYGVNTLTKTPVTDTFEE